MIAYLLSTICLFLGHDGARHATSGCYVCSRCHRLVVLPWVGR